MIRYLKHPDIDKLKWDECINRSINGIVYAHSWYLDIVCPGWDALVEDDYISVFPLTHDRKFGISYLYQPYFTQKLGLFTSNHLTESLVHDFLNSIPGKFRFAEIHLNSMNKVDPIVHRVSVRVNLELDLINTYENIRKKYDHNVKRNLKKAFDSSITIRRKVEPDELITLFSENYGKKEKKLKFRHYEVLRKLMIYCLKKRSGMMMGACLPYGKLCAAVFFLLDQSRIIFHFAASDSQARESGAMFLLIDSFIRDHAGQALTLDFEGSNDPNVARFYKSFGAIECNYLKVNINRLSWITKKAVYFKKRFWQ
jgi:Acetyltransferase (GNAT) domain